MIHEGAGEYSVALLVNPARAGMIPFPAVRLSAYVSKPRASGDDPKDYATAATDVA